MRVTTLRELWQAELQDLYGAEQQIVQALPNMVSKAKSVELKEALEQHLVQTRVQIERLELIFKESGQAGNASAGAPHATAGKAQATSGIEGVIRSGEQLMPSDGPADLSDAALIAAAQHVEHYEMAGYGCARTHARWLDEKHAADLLQQTLDEEGEADHKLTKISDDINRQAADTTRGEPAVTAPRRLRYLDIEDVGSLTIDYATLDVRNSGGENLGKIDGFIVGDSGRPYYVVIDSGGWFIGRRYIVPVGELQLNRDDQALLIDLPKDVFKRYPEFQGEAFLAMSDEEAQRYEWRVIEAIDPEAARRTGSAWDHEQLPYYRRPDWLANETWGPTPSGATRSEGPRRVPIRDQSASREAREDRERVVAHEQESGPEPSSSREMDSRRPDGGTSERIRGSE